jgi:hypothetical protein
MYDDRVNHRTAWFTAISEYNTPDLARLGRELYAEYDIYCGIRNGNELRALKAQGVTEFTIWVDASRRLPPEDPASISVSEMDADYIIDNNGTLNDLRDWRVDHAYRTALLATKQLRV